MRRGLGLAMLLMLSAAALSSSKSPPGKPVLVGCRSPEKETFTCSWQPGNDGGLPTEHRLYYSKEKEKVMHECPDYKSAGKNSCFFNKSMTSIWVEYHMKVVASNALGNTSSDHFTIYDVVHIVKPYPPINVTVTVNNTIVSPSMEIKWNQPPLLDTNSGWVTPSYELRIRQENDEEWTSYKSGRQTFLHLYNLKLGKVYVVQVRCKLAEGSWSEWTNSTYAKFPNVLPNDTSFWILVLVFSLIPLIATICVLVLKRKVLKMWLLPPVPGPKIRGVDVQLLKSGRSQDVVNALIISQNLPPMMPWADQIEDYLIVSDSDEWLLKDPFISQKSKKSIIIAAGSELASETKCEDSSQAEDDPEVAEDCENEMNEFVKLAQSPSGEMINAEMAKLLHDKSTFQSSTHPGYVDVPDPGKETEGTQDDYSRVKMVNGETILILNSETAPLCSDYQIQAKSLADDYSRVKEVNSENLVVLERHDSPDALCRKKKAQWSPQKAALPLSSDWSKTECSEILSNGYVESAPGFTVK